jgi:hypothetical protein
MEGGKPMNVEAVVALIVGTAVVLLIPALLLSPDIAERYRGMRGRAQRH